MLTNNSVLYEENKKLDENEIYRLAEKLILLDGTNCGRDNVGLAFPPAVANKLIDFISIKDEKKYLIINDLSLNMCNKLIEKGIKLENIYLCYCWFNKDNKNNLIIDDKRLYNIIENYLLICYKEKFNCISFAEVKNMKFDYIISNPPYCAGNEITKEIIDNINYDEFINLMPLQTYKKNKLFKYVSAKLGSINFTNSSELRDIAHTAPDICKISKKVIHDYSYTDFELYFYYDKRLQKFYENNAAREKCYLEHTYICAPSKFKLMNSKTAFACGIYTPHDKVHAINHLKNKFSNKEYIDEYIAKEKDVVSRDCTEEYIWNIVKPNVSVEKVFVPVKTGVISQIFTIFKSEKEKDNFINWWYSAEINGKNPKSGLASILLAGLNKPTSCPFAAAIPNVDWTRSWTDEEILKDYGYNDEEIKEILNLGNNNLCRHALGDF